MASKTIFRLLGTTFGVLIFASAPAWAADPVAEFYHGKQIRFHHPHAARRRL